MKRVMKLYLHRITAVMTAAVMLTVMGFTGCNAVAPGNVDDGKIHVVTTIFPIYDWVENVIGDNPGEVEVTMLLDSGVDLHSYQPSAADILKISTCDVFIYVGGESDGWVHEALANAVNRDMKVINLLDALGEGAKEEEMVEGMQESGHDHEDGEEGHNHEDGEDAHDHEDHEYDEHVWLSLRNASFYVGQIADVLSETDPANAATYGANADAYKSKLADLDERYRSTVEAAGGNTLLFGDRFPFRYLTDDYGLEYYVAFMGCSAESEASFETIAFLSGKVDEENLRCVMTIDGSDGKIAQTIISSTKNKDQKILTLDSMQSATSKDYEEGRTYLSIMESNLEVLKEALE